MADCRPVSLGSLLFDKWVSRRVIRTNVTASQGGFIPLNIVEGYARNNKNEFRQFLRIALGSLAEVGYLIQFAHKRKHLTVNEFENVISLKEKCGKLLWKLMKSM